ncbi:MAG: hypothetical protein VB934_18555 [Polyangiaceae bacterium]
MSCFPVAMQVLVAMQAVGPPPVLPPLPAVQPAPAVVPAPVAAAPVSPASVAPPAARPMANPYATPPSGYAYRPWRPLVPPPVLAPKITDPAPRFFVRIDLGFGTRGFSENDTLLAESGFGGLKLWSTLDGAYMIHPRVGAGLWMGLNRRLAEPDESARLHEVAYFIAGQAPIHLWGDSLLSLQVAPRLGFATGMLELGGDGGGHFDSGVMWGLGASAMSFDYHLSATASFMRAQAGPPGLLGGDHDFGGLYFAIGGLIGG